MKTLTILIILTMLGCTKKDDNTGTDSQTSPVYSKTLVCPELIKEVEKLNGKTTIEVAAKVVEFTAPDKESIDHTTNCLDSNLKIECNDGKCLVAKKAN